MSVQWSTGLEPACILSASGLVSSSVNLDRLVVSGKGLNLGFGESCEAGAEHTRRIGCAQETQ